MFHNHNLSAPALTQYFSKESRQALTIPSWLPPGEYIPSIKGTEVEPSPEEGWPDTQHLHFTHAAGQAQGFSGHTLPSECTGPSGFLTLTAERWESFLLPEKVLLYYQTPQNASIFTHWQQNFYHRKLYSGVVIRVWSGIWDLGFLVGLGGSLLFWGWGGRVFFSPFSLTPAFGKKDKNSSHKKLNMWSGGRGGLTSPQTHAKKSTPNQKHRDFKHLKK